MKDIVTKLMSTPVKERLLEFASVLLTGFVNRLEPLKTGVNSNAIFSQLFCVVPKPGVRGSSPLRDATQAIEIIDDRR
jgi:hypothetical protein